MDVLDKEVLIESSVPFLEILISNDCLDIDVWFGSDRDNIVMNGYCLRHSDEFESVDRVEGKFSQQIHVRKNEISYLLFFVLLNTIKGKIQV